MACARRNFKIFISRPLFIIIFRSKIFFCHILNSDRADQSWVCHILGVKSRPKANLDAICHFLSFKIREFCVLLNFWHCPVFCYCLSSKWQNCGRQWTSPYVNINELHLESQESDFNKSLRNFMFLRPRERSLQSKNVR